MGLETLAAGYTRWEELKRERHDARRRWAEREQQLAQQGRFLLGTVRSAEASAPSVEQGLMAPGALSAYLATARAALEAASAALTAERAEGEAGFCAALTEVQALIRGRVDRTLATVRPRFTLRLRHLGAERAILHVDRLSPDEAVLALTLLTGQVPTRYGFLFDDSTEDPSLPQPLLYAEEAGDSVRPDAATLGARVLDASAPLPVKGYLPLWIAEGGSRHLFRMLQRGPVMEVEIADGEGFRNVLTLPEAERFSGHLLRLKLAGRIELEIEAG